jgi:hypothetical protein
MIVAPPKTTVIRTSLFRLVMPLFPFVRREDESDSRGCCFRTEIPGCYAAIAGGYGAVAPVLIAKSS